MPAEADALTTAEHAEAAAVRYRQQRIVQLMREVALLDAWRRYVVARLDYEPPA